MDVAFDPAKDRANRQKHGASLAGAAEMDFDAALVIPDQRQDYGEDRFQAIAPLLGRGRLHVLAFTMRGNRLRAISLRMANA